MITATPDGFEPEPEAGLVDADEVGFVPAAALPVNPESTLRHDVYVNKKFRDIFAHEDRNGALAHAFEVSLSVNDGGRASTNDGLVAWFRAKMEAGR